MKNNNSLFNSLNPQEQKKVASILRAYDKVYLTWENNSLNISTGVCLKAHYSEDHRFLGTINKEDIFTESELMENYINSFHDYPINYQGKRDYRWLNSLSWKDHIYLDDQGNFTI